MVVLAQLVTYVLPKGRYETFTNEHEREQVVPGSFEHIEAAPPLPWYAALSTIPRGFAAAQGIIFFCFIIGGAFGVLRATGAVDALLARLLQVFRHRPFWLLAGTMLAFAVGSSTLGMAEEYIPFIPVLIALAVGLGYDRVVGVGVLCVGYGMGYGTAAINPFTVVIAQDIAGLEPTSGLALRLALMVVFCAVGLHHLHRYAQRVRRDPERSLVADIPHAPLEAPAQAAELTRTHWTVLALLGASVVALVYGISRHGWYLTEMGAMFLGLTLVFAVVARLGADRTAREFSLGASELTTTALLIGVARSVELVLSDGQVLATIIDAVATPLQQAGPSVAAVGMVALQSVCNFFIPSGSGQAYVMMPIMAPLSDLVGVQRQVAVLAYQFGDGFTNIVVPTNAVLVGILTMAGVPFDRWLRFVGPLMLKVGLLAAIAVVVAVRIGYR
jgi:uncharacterized ion transporter superfamily protein YfcC